MKLMSQKILQIPKVELHSHLEGTIQPSLVKQIANRNNMKLRDSLFTPQGGFAWNDFVSFLKAYDEVSSCLLYSKDYRDITYDYFKSCALEGTIYAETFISPDHAAEMGMSYEDVLSGCAQGIDDAERDFGIIGRIIVTCVRHLGPKQAVRIAQLMVDEPHPYVVGFGMGGDESQYAASDFSPAYQIAIDAGYSCTVHAGEVCGPESVWDAINNLPMISRIGHGVRSSEDAELIKTLANRKISLEICPGSNLALDLYPDWESHPLNHILESGINISLNSDDPPYFDTSIGKEYQNGFENFNLDLKQLLQISRMAMESSFADTKTKARLIKQINECSID